MHFFTFSLGHQLLGGLLNTLLVVWIFAILDEINPHKEEPHYPNLNKNLKMEFAIGLAGSLLLILIITIRLIICCTLDSPRRYRNKQQEISNAIKSYFNGLKIIETISLCLLMLLFVNMLSAIVQGIIENKIFIRYLVSGIVIFSLNLIYYLTLCLFVRKYKKLEQENWIFKKKVEVEIPSYNDLQLMNLPYKLQSKKTSDEVS